MDAKKTGALIAGRRKDLGLTQAELAGRLHVTDKAVSRWERGQGFPDIQIMEPLAGALSVSLAELMRGERGAADPFDEAASSAARDVIRLVEMKREERRRIWTVAAAAALALFCTLLADVMGLPGFLGAALPCLGMAAGLALLCTALIRMRRKLPVRATLLWAALFLAVPAVLAVLLFAAGALGAGPVPG